MDNFSTSAEPINIREVEYAEKQEETRIDKTAKEMIKIGCKYCI